VIAVTIFRITLSTITFFQNASSEGGNARKDLAFHPFKEGTASGGDVGKGLCCACFVQGGNGVTATCDGDQFASLGQLCRFIRGGVGGSVEGHELADPKFHPFWAKCEELGLLVFMHPLGTRELEAGGRLAGNGLLTNTIGNPLETTIALSHLIFEGTLDRFPGLKICAAHGGGFLPSYANRSDAVCRTFPNRVGPLPKKSPTAYLKDGQLFFDTIVFTPEALRHLIAETGPAQVMIGTDYPFPWTSTEIDLVLNTPDLSDDERIAILGGTAARLLGI